MLVSDTTPPKVEISFDKDTYLEDDDLTAGIILTDYSEVDNIEVKFDDEEVILDENNMFTIHNLTAGEHVITVIATDTAGNVAKETYITTVEEKEIIDTTPPVLECRLSKDEVIVGEPLELVIVASDDSGPVELSVVASKGILRSRWKLYIYCNRIRRARNYSYCQ